MRRALLLIGLVACSPFEPEYGATPFLCGPSEPRCPEGYTCLPEADTGREVCTDVLPPEVACVDDPNEPNEAIEMATTTTLPATDQRLALCPAGDVDVFVVTTTDLAAIEVLLTYDDGGAKLDAQVLDGAGMPIANAAPLDGTMIRAFTSTLDAGTYFVRVSGPSVGLPATNNYTLTIDLQ